MTSQKICVVTGSNKGIGFAIVKDLCKKFDGIVYLTARDESRGRKAVDELKKLGLSPSFHQLDISSNESIISFVDFIKKTHGGLDILVNNAGMAYKGSATESMGQQAKDTIAVNYFATANAFRLFLPLLRPHSRIVNVSSMAGLLKHIPSIELRNKLSDPALTKTDLDVLMNQFIALAKSGGWKEAGWPSSTYVVSKVGLSALTRIQQRILDNDEREDIVVNSCHPGYVDTDMTSHKGPLTIEEGAVCPVYLALLPPSTHYRGKYFWFDTREVDWIKGPE